LRFATPREATTDSSAHKGKAASVNSKSNPGADAKFCDVGLLHFGDFFLAEQIITVGGDALGALWGRDAEESHHW
jgi:hypothetical protein